MRTISTWSPEEVPATTTTDYLKLGNPAKMQQDWVTPGSNLYKQADSGATVQPPASAATAPKAGTPLPVTGLTVSESAYRANDGSMLSLVSVSFSPNPSDTNFDHVAIWFLGYNGNPNPQLMTQGSSSPVSFLCQTTKETVHVAVQSVGPTGISTPIGSSPARDLTLNGVTSAPPSPTIIQTLTQTPTGYQFQFQQVGGLVADQIAGYEVWRNTANDPNSSTIIKTYPQTKNQNQGAITVQDTVPNGTTYFYWVVSVNTSGIKSSPVAAQSGTIVSGSKLNSLGQLINADQVAADGSTFARIFAAELQQNRLPGQPSVNNVANPCFADQRFNNSGFLSQGAQPCPDWTVMQNDNLFCRIAVVGNDTTSGSPTNTFLQLAPQGTIGPGTYSCLVASRNIAVKPGDVLCVGWLFRTDASFTLPANVTCNLYGEVILYDANGTLSADIGHPASFTRIGPGGFGTGTWAPYTGVIAVPSSSNLASARLNIVIQFVNNTGANLNTNGYAQALITGVYFGLAVNTASQQVAKYGSTPPAGGSPVSYTYTSTSVTFSGTYNGYRTDNNLVTMSAPYNISCTGLTPGTKYYFYPYWDDNVFNLPGSGANPQTVQFATGGVGSTGIAFTAPNDAAFQLTVRADHVPISNGPISITLPTSGSGGGSGGGGGKGGTCPRSDMLVKHRELGVISAGELLGAFRKGGEHYIASLNGWTRVVDMDSSERDEWVTVDFGVDQFTGTPYHPWPTESGEIPSCELRGETIQTTEGPAKHLRTVYGYEKAVAVRITVEEPHIYLCGKSAPCLETHNVILPC